MEGGKKMKETHKAFIDNFVSVIIKEKNRVSFKQHPLTINLRVKPREPQTS